MRLGGLVTALAALAALVLAGCAAAPRSLELIRSRNQARADYADEVTGQQFRDYSNPAEFEVVRFGAVTSRHFARGVRGTAGARVARAEGPMQEVLGSMPPQDATGLRLAYVSRDVAVPAPIVGTHPTSEVGRRLAPGRVIGQAGTFHFATWRDVLVAEVRTRYGQVTSTAGVGQLVQWPGGVHEIISDLSLGTVLMREDVGAAKAPIVVLDFLTRFKQRPQIVLTKVADRERAFPDEVVTFTVTFFNDSPVQASNVIIADVVDQECEYKPDTAQCSRPFTFKVEETAEKRPVLVWRLNEPIGPHEAGKITYQLVVRKAWVR